MCSSVIAPVCRECSQTFQWYFVCITPLSTSLFSVLFTLQIAILLPGDGLAFLALSHFEVHVLEFHWISLKRRCAVGQLALCTMIMLSCGWCGVDADSVSLSVCLTVCLSVSILHMSVRAYVCVCVYACMRAYVCVRACVRVCACIRLCVCVRAYVCVRACMHTCIRTRVWLCRPSVAFSSVSYCIQHREQLFSNTTVLSRFFPNLLKVRQYT